MGEKEKKGNERGTKKQTSQVPIFYYNEACAGKAARGKKGRGRTIQADARMLEGDRLETAGWEMRSAG